MSLQFGLAISSHRLAFAITDRVSIDRLAMRFISTNEDGCLFEVDDGSGCVQSYTHHELNQYAAQGRLTHQIGYFLPENAKARLKQVKMLISELPKRQRIAFAKRDAWVLAFMELQREGMKCTDASIKANLRVMRARAQDFVAESRNRDLDEVTKTTDFFREPSTRTLRRWVKQFHSVGVSGLVDRISARGNRGNRLSPAVNSLMNHHVLDFMSEKRPTKAMIVEKVERAFRAENEKRDKNRELELKIPSRSTIYRAIKALDPFDVAVARHDVDYARKKFAPVGNGINLTRPLERVEIDEYRADAMTLMAAAGLDRYLSAKELADLGLDGKNKRWLITVAICATTRCIVGMSITRDAKGSAAKQVLQMIVSDKGKWSSSVHALGSWDMHGRPECIVTDNGAAFISETFRHACADLGAAHVFTPPGTPEMRARIERFFRTLAITLMRRLSGHTFSSIMEKRNANPEAGAALTFDDFAFALVRWIVDVYHNQPHQGLNNETPLECWRRLTKKIGVAPAPSNREFRLIFGERLKRKLDRTGITVMGLRYHSEDLAHWMNRNGEAVLEVAWHPRDIGAILVFINNEWVQVPALDPRFHGVAAQTWLFAARDLKSTYSRRQEFDHDTIFKALDAIEARNSEAMALAGLLVEDWSEEKLLQVERRTFVGFRESTRAPSDVVPAPDDKSGMSIAAAQEVGKGTKVAAKRSLKSNNWNVEG